MARWWAPVQPNTYESFCFRTCSAAIGQANQISILFLSVFAVLKILWWSSVVCKTLCSTYTHETVSAKQTGGFTFFKCIAHGPLKKWGTSTGVTGQPPSSKRRTQLSCLIKDFNVAELDRHLFHYWSKAGVALESFVATFVLARALNDLNKNSFNSFSAALLRSCLKASSFPSSSIPSSSSRCLSKSRKCSKYLRISWGTREAPGRHQGGPRVGVSPHRSRSALVA